MMDDNMKSNGLEEKGDYKDDDTLSLISEDEADTPPEKGWKYNKTEWLVLFTAAALYFIGGVVTSMIAAFFPQVAKNKGIDSSLTGIIFGVFPLVFALVSPLIGKLIPLLGIKTILYAGVLVEGVCMLLYGIVASWYNGDTFIVLSFLYRIVTALGVAASENSSLLLVCLVFSDKGLLEVAGSIGLMIGPLIGGGLYKVGGFVTPFILAGGINIILFLLLVFFLPALGKEFEDNKDNSDSVGLSQILFLPGIVIMCTVIVVFGTGISFMEPTMALHLKEITEPHPMSSAGVGLIFLLLTAVYGLASPIVGYLDDNKYDGKYLILAGTVISAISFLFVGPTPLFRPVVKAKLWVVCISLILFGMGFALGLIPVISQMKECLLENGIPENEKSLATVTSVFNCFLNIGYVLGPVAGGYMVQYSSFAWASTIMAYLMFGELILVLLFTIIERCF